MANTTNTANKNGVFINWLSAKLVRDAKSGDREFKSVSVPTENGFMSIAVNEGCIIPSTKRDGTVVDGYVSVLIGQKGSTKKVSVPTADGTGYETIEMAVTDIADKYNAQRAAYRAAQKAPATAEAK